MMYRWIESVRSTKKLLVYNGITNAKWLQVFAPAIQSFNKLPIAITAKAVDKQDDAHVVIFTSNGKAEFTHDNETKTATFDANRLHGYTMLFHREKLMERAAVFLPSEPRIVAGYLDSGETNYEDVNLNQMRVVAVHELIHACGLDNDEHDDNGVFQKNLVPMGNQVGNVISSKGNKLMPPIYLSGGTKAKIIKNWSK